MEIKRDRCLIRGLQQADLHLSLVLPSINGILFVAFSSVFFLRSTGSGKSLFLLCRKYMIQPLLNGSNTSGVFAFDHIGDLFWKLQLFFCQQSFRP